MRTVAGVNPPLSEALPKLKDRAVELGVFPPGTGDTDADRLTLLEMLAERTSVAISVCLVMAYELGRQSTETDSAVEVKSEQT